MRRLFRQVRASKLFALGTWLVVLGALVEGLEAFGALDLSPFMEPGLAGALISAAGVLKIVLRIAMSLIAMRSVTEDPLDERTRSRVDNPDQC